MVWPSAIYKGGNQHIFRLQKTAETATTKKASAHHVMHGGWIKLKKWRLPTLPHCIAVPSAQVGLTSLFGMGRGGTPPQ